MRRLVPLLDLILALELGWIAVFFAGPSWCTPTAPAFGFPLPWTRWTVVSSLEYQVFPMALIADLGALWILALALLRGLSRVYPGALPRIGLALTLAFPAALGVGWLVLCAYEFEPGFPTDVTSVHPWFGLPAYDDDRCPGMGG